ncbi:hypothetical protein, partial [Thalassospira profundimaris]|uniref:hypothetical protein n=1 Tax=Thalassospira profundimaris TaxID=502049 RepID=UPI0039E8CA4F
GISYPHRITTKITPGHTKGQRTTAALIAFYRHPSATTNALNPVIPTQVGIHAPKSAVKTKT